MSALFPNGGPVHPVRLPIPGATHANGAPQPTELHTGMNLRDHFTGLAMQGICGHHDTWGLSPEGIAQAAYEMADLMLHARTKEPPCQS